MEPAPQFTEEQRAWGEWLQQHRPKRLPPVKLPVTLHAKQQDFYDDDRLEILYGGAAGGGKSVAMLASALKYVHVPGYSALLLRRKFPHLTMPSGLIPLAREWLYDKARWDPNRYTWVFPSGATLTFGYLDHDSHLDRYQGAEFTHIGFDEATQFKEHHYRYLFSRLRASKRVDAPLRFRASANPGGIGHDFIKRRFILEGEESGRRFIPAKLEDNPSLDREEYERSLLELDPLTRMRLLNGDWDAVPDGGMFKRSWFDGNIIDWPDVPKGMRWERYWDRAATDVDEGTDPDYTAGALVGLHKGVWYVGDMVHFRKGPQENEVIIARTAASDGSKVRIHMEQEPGSSGKDVISHYGRHVLRGYIFGSHRPTGSKVERAAPLASAAERGLVKIVNGPWVNGFLDELCAFPIGRYKDRVDAVSGAFGIINQRPRAVRGFKAVNL